MAYFVPCIDETGVRLPTYADRLEDLLAAYRSIFGADAVLDESTPDYQLLSVFARALDDTSALVLQDYNSRNPDYAAGRSLDLLASLFGLSRRTLQSGTETDASLRLRIRATRAALACASRDSLEAALRSLPYVSDVSVAVNETDQPNADGIPPHALACVVYGGRPADIARTIFDKKAPGIATWGSASADVPDARDRPHTVFFSRPDSWLVTVVIRIRPLEGYDASVQEAMRTAVAEFIQGLGIGRPLVVSELYGVCYGAVPASRMRTFMIGDILTSTSRGAHSDVYPCAWNERLTARPDTVSFETLS